MRQVIIIEWVELYLVLGCLFQDFKAAGEGCSLCLYVAEYFRLRARRRNSFNLFLSSWSSGCSTILSLQAIASSIKSAGVKILSNLESKGWTLGPLTSRFGPFLFVPDVFIVVVEVFTFCTEECFGFVDEADLISSVSLSVDVDEVGVRGDKSIPSSCC